MLAKKRRDKIYDMIVKNGAIETAKAASALNVSIETLRKDLIAMEREGLILRTHGGAVNTDAMRKSYSLSQRSEEYIDEKENLVSKACELIADGDIIAIDEGSTAKILAKSIKDKFKNLTVITYSLDVFNVLCGEEGFKLILCGGNYMKKEKCFYGAQTLDALNNLYFQKAFIFPAAVSLKSGICINNENFIPLFKQLMSAAEQVYILADSSKFEKKALFKISDTDKKFNFVTDCNLGEDLKNLYKKHKMKLFVGGKSK